MIAIIDNVHSKMQLNWEYLKNENDTHITYIINRNWRNDNSRALSRAFVFFPNLVAIAIKNEL